MNGQNWCNLRCEVRFTNSIWYCMRTGIFVLIVSLNDVSGLNISTWYRTISNKSRVMSDESCFTTDAVVRRQVKNFSCELLTLRKIWSFPLRISPVNVTKILRELHNKNIRTRSGTLFWRFLVNFEPIWHVVFVFFIVTFLKKNAAWDKSIEKDVCQ